MPRKFFTWKKLLVRLCSSALAVVVILSGCATVTTTDGQRLTMRSPEFLDYVERVFREQNRWATELLNAQDEAEGARYEELIRAEDSLLTACAGLNELATARRDARALGPLRQAKLARSAPECEAVTTEARRVITREAFR